MAPPSGVYSVYGTDRMSKILFIYSRAVALKQGGCTPLGCLQPSYYVVLNGVIAPHGGTITGVTLVGVL